MLITFFCDAHASITMFGDVGVRLIKMMGHSGTVPSAILADQVPDALHQLMQAILQEKNNPSKQAFPDENKEGVSLVNRAYPLITFLQSAVDKKCNVMWK